MEIRSFLFESGPLEAFIKLPATVYAGDPRWIPPFTIDVRRRLSTENPFLEYGGIKNFLAVDGDRTLGRVTALRNPRLVVDGDPIGLFGFFEVTDNYEAAAALWDAARDWLRRRGCKRVWGPMNFHIWDAYRFMTKGFETEPFAGEPYNPSYYPEFAEE